MKPLREARGAGAVLVSPGGLTTHAWLQVIPQGVAPSPCIPCCLVITDDRLFTCHEDCQTSFFRSLGTAKLADVSAVSLEPGKEYCILVSRAGEGGSPRGRKSPLLMGPPPLGVLPGWPAAAPTLGHLPELPFRTGPLPVCTERHLENHLPGTSCPAPLKTATRIPDTTVRLRFRDTHTSPGQGNQGIQFLTLALVSMPVCNAEGLSPAQLARVQDHRAGHPLGASNHWNGWAVSTC